MITQLQSLKDRLKIPASDETDDVLLTGLILAMGERLELECNRKFERVEDGTFEFRADTMDVIVDRGPVEDVSAWHLKSSEAEGWELQSDIVYILGPTRTILELSSPLGNSRQMARVTYTGGYVMPPNPPEDGEVAEPVTIDEGQTALPKLIEHAALEQCAAWYRDKDRLGLDSVSGPGGAISKVAGLDLLPSVRSVIKKYERWLP